MNELFRDTSVLETLRPYFKKRGFIRGVSPLPLCPSAPLPLGPSAPSLTYEPEKFVNTFLQQETFWIVQRFSWLHQMPFDTLLNLYDF